MAASPTLQLLLALLCLSLMGCDGSTDDDSAGDDDADDLEEVDLVDCLDDLDCPYLFGCGHRGTTMFAPENTLLGYEMALGMGVEMVEIDVRPTADEVLVLMHDSSVDRTTDGTGDVDEMTLAQIRQLVVVSSFEDIDDQPIPTFTEFLDAFRGRVLVNVDAKTSRFDLIVADIEAADARDWCYVQVDNMDEGLEMRQLAPTMRIMPDVMTVEDVDLYADALTPELYEHEWQADDPAVVARAMERGGRSLQNSLGPADAAAMVHDENGDDACVAFETILGTGVSIIQTDVPHLLVPCLHAINAEHGYRFTPQ